MIINNLQEILNKEGELDSYTFNQLFNQFNLKEEINKFYPCELYFDKGEQLIKIQLMHNYLDIVISENHKKQKELYCNLNQFKNINQYSINNIKNNYTKPYNFTVLSTKVIEDWIKYYEIVFFDVRTQNDSNKLKVDTFLNSIKDYHIQWEIEDEIGEITKSGIKYKFIINTDHVTEYISVDTNLVQNLDLFLRLSNNKVV